MSYRPCSLISPGGQARIVGQVKVAKTFWDRAMGLLFRKELGEREFLLIRPCGAVHTFFMRFSIDVIFLSENGEIMKILSDVRPYRFAAQSGARATLETRARAASVLGFRVGDKLQIDKANDDA